MLVIICWMYNKCQEKNLTEGRERPIIVSKGSQKLHERRSPSMTGRRSVSRGLMTARSLWLLRKLHFLSAQGVVTVFSAWFCGHWNHSACLGLLIWVTLGSWALSRDVYHQGNHDRAASIWVQNGNRGVTWPLPKLVPSLVNEARANYREEAAHLLVGILKGQETHWISS